jgi:hypothetical protein
MAYLPHLHLYGYLLIIFLSLVIYHLLPHPTKDESGPADTTRLSSPVLLHDADSHSTAVAVRVHSTNNPDTLSR